MSLRTAALSLLVSSACLLLPATAPAAVPSTPDAGTWAPDGKVHSMALDGDTLYLGGSFNYLGPRTGSFARLDAAGASDAGWARVSGGNVYAAIADGAGGWFIGGSFTRVDGQARTGLARVDENGDLDTGWTPGVTGSVRSLLLDGGRLYVGGDIRIGGFQQGLATVDAATGAHDGWAAGIQGTVHALVKDGSTIFAGGYFQIVNGGQAARSYLAAFDTTDADGSNVLGWAPHLDGQANALAIVGSTLYVGGEFQNVGIGWTDQRSRLAAYDVSGAGLAVAQPRPLNSWVPEASGPVYSLAVSGSTLYVGGAFGSVGGTSRSNLAAVDATSGLVEPWDPSPGGSVRSLTVAPGSVYAGGDFHTVGGTPRVRLAEIDSTTGATTAWNPGAADAVRAIALDGADVLAAGDFTSAGGVSRSSLAAIDVTTGRPTAWAPEASNSVSALAVGGGHVYVAGTFGSVGGQNRRWFAELSAATGNATALTLEPDAFDSVETVVVDGGTVYVGGSFDSFGGQARDGIAAFDAATDAVTPWNPDADGPVMSILPHGGLIYVGGDFAAIGGQSRQRLAAIDPGTGAATGWNPEADGTVQALAASGSKIFAAGGFTYVHGLHRRGVASINAITATPTSWNPKLSGGVTDMSLAGGTVYLKGWFHPAPGTINRSGNAAIDADTGQLAAWDPAWGDSSSTDRILASDGAVYMAGSVNPTGAVAVKNLASFTGPPENVASPSAGGTLGTGQTLTCDPGTWTGGGEPTYEWLRGGMAIVGASGDQYTQVPADDGTELKCRVTMANPGGSTSALSAVAGSPAPPQNTVAPELTGTPAVGQVLTCSPGTWTGSPTLYSYTWTRDGETIVGSASTLGDPATWTVLPADGGHRISCRVRASNAGGSASVTVEMLIPSPPANWAMPSVSGTGVVGQMLTCDPGLWDNDPDSFTYQWFDAIDPIPGATGSTYTIAPTVLSQSLTCKVTGTNEGGSTTAPSNVSVFVPGMPAPVDGDGPSVSGVVDLGETLTCARGAWNGSPASYVYAWLRDGVPIGGESASSYSVRAADIGKSIVCRVSATGDGGVGTASSAAAAQPVAPTSSVAPAIEGSASVGATVSCRAGSWANRPNTLTYRWLRGNDPSPVATGASYTVQAADVGQRLWCEVTASNSAGSAQARAGVDVVTPAAPDPASTSGGGSAGSSGVSTGGSGGASPPPPQDTSAPRVRVTVGRGALAVKGAAISIKLSACPREERGCRVTVTLKSGKVVLGKGAAKLAPGRPGSVRVALTKKGRSLLRGRKRVKASLQTVVRDDAGNTATATQQVSLSAGRR